MPVDVMLASMSNREFVEWQAYFGIEPFGEERADLRAGIVAATVANAAGGRGKGRAAKPTDFMVDFAKARGGAPAGEIDREAVARQVRMTFAGIRPTRRKDGGKAGNGKD